MKYLVRVRRCSACRVTITGQFHRRGVGTGLIR